MAKFGRTVKCCAFVRYQSVVIGLTFSYPPADVGYALSLLAGLVVTSKFTFFNECIGRADTATNSQTSPMLDVIRNFMRALWLIIAFFIFAVEGLGQVDSSNIFLKSKGTWNYPIKNVSKIETIIDRNKEHGFTDPKNISFYANDCEDVKCVHEGKVILVTAIDTLFVIITKFGDYYITYDGLSKTNIKVGDYILVGQEIGLLGKNFNDEFCINVYLSINDKGLDASVWFKK